MLQGAAIRWLELNRDWRHWGRAWLSTVKSVQLVLPIDASDLHENDPEQTAEQQQERVAALVHHCPGCTSIRLRIKQEPFFDTAALAGSNESDYAEKDSESPSSEIDDERPAPTDIEGPLDINAGLCALAEFMGPQLLKLDLGNNCGLGPPLPGYLDSAGIVMDEGLDSVAALCPNIVALDLSHCAPGFSDREISFMGVHPATLLRLVESCGRSLKSLNIAGILCSETLSFIPSSHPQLPTIPRPAILSETIRQCPALQYLNIKENNTMAGSSSVNRHQPSSDNDSLPPYVSMLISTCAENLKCLDVRHVGSARWDKECLMAVLEGCRNLKKIRWSSGSGISEGTRSAVARRHPHVRFEVFADEYDDSDSEDFVDFDDYDVYDEDDFYHVDYDEYYDDMFGPYSDEDIYQDGFV